MHNARRNPDLNRREHRSKPTPSTSHFPFFMTHSNYIADHVRDIPALGDPRLFRDRPDHAGRHLTRHRRARLPHAVAHPRGCHLRPRARPHRLHLQSRPAAAARTHRTIRAETFPRRVRPGIRNHRDRRRQRGNRPRAARTFKSRRRGALPRAVLRELQPERDPRARRPRRGPDICGG